MFSDSQLPLDQNFLDDMLSTIREKVRVSFPTPDRYHGIEHAENVEKRVMEEVTGLNLSIAEIFCLRSAALLHDVGYSSSDQTWSQDKREHVEASLHFAENALQELKPYFASELSEQLINSVLFLILRHDDTNYIYPSMVYDGAVKILEVTRYTSEVERFISSLDHVERENIRLLSKLLKEADAFCATGIEGAVRTYEYSKTRQLPLATHGSVFGWCWEESVLGNVRLASKRALVDASTRRGKQGALRNYFEVEDYIQARCIENGITYTPEKTPFLDGQQIQGREEEFRLKRYRNWQELVEMIRTVPLKGDGALHPYKTARIQPRLYSLNSLRPTAFYVLQTQVELQRYIFENLRTHYALGLFDLTGVIEYELGNTIHVMSPPIVERYYESRENRVVSVIVDGLHRAFLARQLGIDAIWVVEITEIPSAYPLIPLPADWHDVKAVSRAPDNKAKREYRFPSYEKFIRSNQYLSNISNVSVTEENFLYFFYRDLSAIGSRGIRNAQDS